MGFRVTGWLIPMLAIMSSSGSCCWAFLPPLSSGTRPPSRSQSSTVSSLDMAAIGIFFGTSTGNTQDVADKIYEAFGPDVAAEPVDVDGLDDGQIGSAFLEHGALVVGTPTWNTGADTERSGTGWDELYYGKLPELKSGLQGKKVAVFGLGDQVSYAENYADATGELYDVFESLGCKMLGTWGMDGYEHEASKSIRGDKFCGLLLDQVNQEDLTDERVETWVVQLKEEGILEGGSSGAAAAPSVLQHDEVVNGVQAAPASSAGAATSDDKLSELVESSTLLDQTIASHSGGFTPHYNPVKGTTMWTSPDGRKSYVTAEKPTSQLSP